MGAVDWAKLYGGPHAWLAARTIYLTRHGSHAYGTTTPSSDLDLKGVCVPPARYFHGFLEHFEQVDQHDPDLVVYDVRKFFALAAECNPGIVEVLWTDASDHLLVTPVGEKLLAHRALFLSRRARHTFAGYALSQLKRIKTHRRWLLSPPQGAPTRAQFGLPDRPTLTRDELGAVESQVQKRIESWELDLEPFEPALRIALQERLQTLHTDLGIGSDEARFHAAARSIGLDDNLMQLVEKERAYRAAASEWEQFQTWVQKRNPERAALEAKFLYDTKHGAHLVRLLRMCAELLETGRVQVRRPDADELRAIRQGAWTYDTLLAWAEAQEARLDALVRASPLPPAPDRARIDALCVELVEEMLRDA